MHGRDRIARAMCAVEGLTVGDAFGRCFFSHRPVLAHLWAAANQAVPRLPDLTDDLGPPPWRWTDDSAMAIAIMRTLLAHQTIDQDDLAQQFAITFVREPRRGYGSAMHRLLPQLREKKQWQHAPRQLFEGKGSFGNGAAMRVAPVGAFFADDFDVVVEQATRSAIITHTHPEGIAGAVAVAVATALAWQLQGKAKPTVAVFLEQVLRYTPESEVAKKLREAQTLGEDPTGMTAAQRLGNGSQVSAQDTVPFVVWAAARYLSKYDEALWETVSGLGDMDTTCAMVGGIVVMYTGIEGIPQVWRARREPLPSDLPEIGVPM